MSDSPAAIPHIGSNLGQSVVPDLMKVYESLTQSSTPHTSAPGANAGGTADSTEQHSNAGRPGKQLPMSPTSYEQQQQQYAAYEPPLPDLAQAPPSLAAAATTASPSASSKEKPSSSSSSAGRGVRSSTRKRGRESQQSQGQATSASASSSGGRGSGGSRSRKKTTKADGRWSKRFQWPDELHREFVSAVFDVGLKHASPSAIMEFMDVTSNTGSNNNHGASITSERVKSHLQKYRLHRARSKKEFLATYDAAMAKMRKRGSDGSNEDAAMGPQGYLVDREEIAALASGEVAAHLTCVASATDDAAIALPPTSTSAAPSSGGKQLAASMVEATTASSSSSSNVLHLPQLTEEEKRSPIGASMGYLMGLFFALQQQLSHQRAAKQARQDLYQQQQDQAAAAAPHSPLEAPPTNPAGPEYGSYVAPPPQPPSHPGPSHSPHQETPQQHHQQHRYHQHPSHHNHHQHHHHHQPFGSHHDGQQAIETSTSAILEENNMMKRDMRAQMRFQNQMRAFKDKEVAKVQQQPPVHPRQHPHHGHTAGSSSSHHQHQHQDQHDAFAEAVKEQDSAFAAAAAAAAAGEASSGEGGHHEDPTATAAAIAAAAAASASGRAPSPGPRARGASIGLSDADFWDSSLDDNELFDFLTGM